MAIKKGKKQKSETKKKGEISEKQTEKKELDKSQNKILKNFLIGMGGIIIFIFFVIFIINQINSFEYQGVKFKVVKFCDTKPCLITYNTEIPVIYKRKNTTYNFYLRNDPRKLGENVEFNGSLVFRDLMVLNSTSDFNCDGDGIIAVRNLLNLYEIARISVIKDENATCDATGRYLFVKLQESNKTGIEKVGSACYNININNCEILEGTERFMVETFVKINEALGK